MEQNAINAITASVTIAPPSQSAKMRRRDSNAGAKEAPTKETRQERERDLVEPKWINKSFIWREFVGPQCQRGYNACAEEHMSCSGHGVCSLAGKHNISFECSCEVGWEGRRCEVRRPLCVVANESNQTICLNGGLCKDLDAEKGSYICNCASGWWGQHCEKKAAIIYKIVFAVIVYVAIGLITLTTIISFIFFFCKRKRKPVKPTLTFMAGSQLSKAQPELMSLSFPSMKNGEACPNIPQLTLNYSLPPDLPLERPQISIPDQYAFAAFV
ncbi:unnamed protein product [Rodentolepis nana]|uniref:EGF-like domain-containing protein n=1 Tax=Rodentolepis nana TaxID=102285 RepID=A0A3P7T5U8_RODNA|nr:unnamed protein product [Rodentolepis nana]